MGIEGNYGYMRPNTDLSTVAPGTEGVQGASQTQEASDAAAVRFQEARASVANEASLPVIDDANLTSLEDMEACLKSLSDKLTSTLSAQHGKKVMFDVYALMSLIQEISQKMRNALREVRQLENQAIQMNLKQQAEVQRYAATTAAIAGAVLCTVQGVVTAALTAGTVKQMSTQSKVMEQNGVGVYDKQSRMAQNVSDNQAANMQAMKVAKQNPELWAETRMSNGEAARTEVNQADGNLTTAREELQQAQAEAQTARTELDAARKIATGEVRNKPEGGQYSIKDRAQAMETVKAKEAAVQNADEKVAKCTEKVAEAEAGVTKAKEAVPAALQKDVDAYAAKYDAVRSRANVELETKGKISPETKAELTKAENQLEIARAKQVATIANMRSNGDLPASAETDLKTAADMRYAQATTKSQSGIEATKNQRSIMQLQMIQTLNMTIGQYGQQLVSSLQQIMGAEAIELQAEQKMTEDQLDQIKDLMQQELSVIQKTFELFASVVSKESQTIEGIIRA